MNSRVSIFDVWYSLVDREPTSLDSAIYFDFLILLFGLDWLWASFKVTLFLGLLYRSLEKSYLLFFIPSVVLIPGIAFERGLWRMWVPVLGRQISCASLDRAAHFLQRRFTSEIFVSSNNSLAIFLFDSWFLLDLILVVHLALF